MRRNRTEAAVCFVLGVALSVGASLGVQAAVQTTAAAVALPAPAPTASLVAVSVPAPVAIPADDAPVLAVAPLPVSRYAASDADDAEPGGKLGRFRFTRYYVVDQSRFAASDDTVTIYDDRECKEIASLSRSFVRELDMEGTGRLRDGRTINVSDEHCRCGRAPCYRTMGGDARWGVGARGEPLEPFRTVAVDPRVIPMGTHLYIAELDGLTMPGPAPWGGFVHDGCVVAIDVGGRIHGRDVDLFVGRHVHNKAFDAHHRIEHVTVFRAGERCDPPQF